MDRHYQVIITVPAGTTIIAPQVTAVPLENALLVAIELVIPPGHAGLTGIRVLQSQQQILPWANFSWINGNDYVNTFPVNEEVGARAITVAAYNIDAFIHTFTLRFHIADLHSSDTGGIGGGIGAAASSIADGTGLLDSPLGPSPVEPSLPGLSPIPVPGLPGLPSPDAPSPAYAGGRRAALLLNS